MRIVATGTFLDEYPDPEAFLSEGPLTPELRDELRRAQAGELVFVRSTEFVEFDTGEGGNRWEETPQGPHAVPLGESATSALLAIVGDYVDFGGLAELGIAVA